jgi:EAL domain-containing protein (putative c-di-GMP-specific phosphodiesterase class I)
VQHQRETGQIVSDIDEVLNEDVLALYTWRGVIAQIPGTLTGLGILGTFVGLLLGLRNISFVTVEAALGSVQSILAGIDTAFYTSIAGVILSILFNIINNVLRNIMNRETGLFLEEFHKTVIPTTDEQARYSSRREVRQILELLDRLPKNTSNGALTGEAMSGNGGNERVLMPQILDGLRKNEFTFFLQPRYELNTRKVIGAEALVRWNHPVLGVVSPAVFIPVLESNGYITKLDQYIWGEVCKTIRVWIDEGVRPMPITVNVTKTDILAIDVAEFFSGMLKKYRIPPKYLDIDISRTAYLETHDVLSETVAQLQQVGFRVVLDGFDGNYMELSALGDIGTDVLKLDLCSAEMQNRTNALPGIFVQARTLRLNLLAEGIESAEQLNVLRKAGCTEGQGYFFSRPLSVDEFAKILKVGHAG